METPAPRPVDRRTWVALAVAGSGLALAFLYPLSTASRTHELFVSNDTSQPVAFHVCRHRTLCSEPVLGTVSPHSIKGFGIIASGEVLVVQDRPTRRCRLLPLPSSSEVVRVSALSAC